MLLLRVLLVAAVAFPTTSICTSTETEFSYRSSLQLPKFKFWCLNEPKLLFLQVAADSKRLVGFLLDTKGPEVRTAMLRGGKDIELVAGK